jgi:hypothetical protein
MTIGLTVIMKLWATHLMDPLELSPSQLKTLKNSLLVVISMTIECTPQVAKVHILKVH